jgi:hypothetical protein
MIWRRLAIVIATSIVASSARADEAPRVGLAGDVSGVIADRLRAELGARGFEVRTVDPFVVEAPGEPGVAAVLRVSGPERRVEVWTGSGGAAQLRATVTARSEDDETLAVRAAEDVRALLGHAEHPAGRPPPDPRPETHPESAPPAPPPPPSRFALGVDAALVVPSGPTAAGGAVVRARYDLAPPLGLGARLFLPVIPSKVSTDAGSTSIAASAAAIEGYLRLVGDAGAPWEAGFAAGAALVWLRMSGSANAPLVGRPDDVWTALPFASLEVSRALGARVRARATFMGGIAAPAVTIRFGDSAVSSWGAPLAVFALGADLGL